MMDYGQGRYYDGVSSWRRVSDPCLCVGRFTTNGPVKTWVGLQTRAFDHS